jgi:hypothetical protein
MIQWLASPRVGLQHPGSALSDLGVKRFCSVVAQKSFGEGQRSNLSGSSGSALARSLPEIRVRAVGQRQRKGKLVKNVRSPRCKSRSIHERDFSRSSNCAPRARKSVARKLTPKLSTGNSYVRYLTVCQKVPSIKPVASGAASGDLTAQTIGQSWRQQSRCRFGLVLLKALSPETTY